MKVKKAVSGGGPDTISCRPGATTLPLSLLTAGIVPPCRKGGFIQQYHSCCAV